MKIIVKYNKAVKLYSGELKYEALFNFVQKEFNLADSTILLSYEDEEKDNISIVSSEDFEVMMAMS